MYSSNPVEDADCFGDKLEQEEEEYYEQLDFQRNNWLDAVAKSSSSNSSAIFLDTLCNNNFEQRVAKLLIDGYNSGEVNITEVYKLFDDMATNYAELSI